MDNQQRHEIDLIRTVYAEKFRYPRALKDALKTWEAVDGFNPENKIPDLSRLNADNVADLFQQIVDSVLMTQMTNALGTGRPVTPVHTVATNALYNAATTRVRDAWNDAKPAFISETEANFPATAEAYRTAALALGIDAGSLVAEHIISNDLNAELRAVRAAWQQLDGLHSDLHELKTFGVGRSTPATPAARDYLDLVNPAPRVWAETEASTPADIGLANSVGGQIYALVLAGQPLELGNGRGRRRALEAAKARAEETLYEKTQFGSRPYKRGWGDTEGDCS